MYSLHLFSNFAAKVTPIGNGPKMSEQDVTEKNTSDVVASSNSPEMVKDRPPPTIDQTQTTFGQPPITLINDSEHIISEGRPKVIASRRNPFSLPTSNILLLRNEEDEHRSLERQRQMSLPIHEKVTCSAGIRAKQSDLKKELQLNNSPVDQARTDPRKDPEWKRGVVAHATNHDSVSDYVSKRREMFLIEYCLTVKREVIHNLTETAAKEDRRLRKAERFLEEDVTTFDAFLKENDMNSVHAIKIAENETKTKLEKVAEIKRLSGKMVAVKSEISKKEEILKEFSMYHDFLLKLSPPEWQQRQRERSVKVRQIEAALKEEKEREQLEEREKPNAKTGRSRENVSKDREMTAGNDPRPLRVSTKDAFVPKVDASKLEEYKVPELYFKEPQQMLDLLTELEQQNLTLIQHSRETEETLEEFRVSVDKTRRKMENEEAHLIQEIDMITCNIQRERERSAELELKARLYSFGNYKAEDQDEMLEHLCQKVCNVYKVCFGDSDANLTTLQMLTNIENRMGQLLENIELVPRDRLLVAERARDKERRLRLREEKIHLQKQLQDERLKKALERAHADVKKPMGKKLMYRSQPQVRENLKQVSRPDADLELEKHLYFFT